MRPNKKKILFACQKRFGGYTGRDIDKIARIFGFSRRTVKRNVEKWSKTDLTFAELKRGNSPIPQSTLYRIINSPIDTLTHGASQELHWLVLQGIEVFDAYNLANARASLSDP